MDVSSSHEMRFAVHPRIRNGDARAAGDATASSPGFASNAQNASSTTTCAMVTASGPSLSTDSSMRPGRSCTRVMASRSTGGTFAAAEAVGRAGADDATSSAPSSTSGEQGEEPHRAAQTLTLDAGATHPSPRSTPQDSRRASSARNRPIHPSSANSLWCAWNMKSPL